MGDVNTLKDHTSVGRLTTHVLDVSSGKPAAGLRIDLYSCEDDTQSFILTVHTNADGRCDAPLLSGDTMKSGDYELRFHAGAYFDESGPRVSGRRFLNIIPIRFGIDKITDHYHVPLLVAAHGYSTYRGS